MTDRSADWGAFPGARGISDEEIDAVGRVLERRTLYRGAGLAPPLEVDALEDELAIALGRRHALTLNSGTSALVATYKALGIRPGDEIVLPTYGWLTNVSAVLEVGAIPVFAPIGADLTLDARRLEAALSPRTAAITVVGSCGLAADINLIRETMGSHRIPIVEDACQSLGARRDDSSRSDVTIVSFQAFKIVTGGEGGALVTDDEAVYRAALKYHDGGLSRFARTGERSWKPTGIGLNLRISELTAAMVRVQLARLGTTMGRLHATRAAMVRIFEESGLDLVVRPAMAGAENGAFLVVTCPEATSAARVHTALRAKQCPIELASHDELHCIVGWREYLVREGFEHRAIDLDASHAILERTLTLGVRWGLSPEHFDVLRAGLADAGR